MDNQKNSSNQNTVDQNSEQWLFNGKKPELPSLHWDLLRYFLTAADAGSFRAAATILSTSVNIVRSRIDELEHQMNCVLFIRSSNGIELTPEARAIYPVAVEINQNISQLSSVAVEKGGSTEGLVRVGITEGLGSFWLARKCGELLDKYPKIRLDLKGEMRVQDVSRTDCHLTIQLEKPRNPDLIVSKIATLHFTLFATTEYLERNGGVRNQLDLANHSMVHQVAEQVPSSQLQDIVTFDPEFSFVKMVANTSSAQAFAIESGAMIGMLPTYAPIISDKLICVLPEFTIKRSVYLVYSKEMMKMRRVKAVTDWAVRSFDPKKYPWFRDEFIHPDEFEV